MTRKLQKDIVLHLLLVFKTRFHSKVPMPFMYLPVFVKNRQNVTYLHVFVVFANNLRQIVIYLVVLSLIEDWHKI